jgi:cell division protein FtsB
MPRPGAHRKGSTKAVLALFVSPLLVIIVLFGMGRYGWITMLRLNRKHDRIKREMLVNLAHSEILCREIKRLKADSFYLEIQAREKMGMTKPGETSYRFYPADSLKKRP